MSAAALLGGAALVAALELDTASLGQFMVGRPIVVGPLLGVLFGQPALGAGLGALFELFSLGELPVGGKVPLNGTVGVGAAYLLCAGGGLFVEFAFALGLVVAAAHGFLETALRRLRGPQSSAAMQLGGQAAATFCLLALSLSLRVLGDFSVPDSLAGGLRMSFTLAPWVGAAAALSAVRGRA